jgi:hypothetical protein
MKTPARLALAAAAIALVVFAGSAAAPHASALPLGNAAQQWNKIAEDTVVGGGAFQLEGFVYMAYVSKAMDAAVNPGERKGQSPDAAVVQAAYDVLLHYFPAQQASLTSLHDEALAAIPDSAAKRNGIKFGGLAADKVIRDRAGDGLQTPIGSTSPLDPLPFGPGVWRLTPPYVAAQTPWVGNVRPFILENAEQFAPPPPPSLSSQAWIDGFNEVKEYGQDTNASGKRTAEQTTIARFWTANVVRQYSIVTRSIAGSLGYDVPETARLFAMVYEIAADTGITLMHAKYHYRFWRPVTAIDPSSVTNDNYGTTPGPSDGNPATEEEAGWRPLVTPTPNHPEYPSAHSSVSTAVSSVFAAVLGTPNINLDIPGGPTLASTRHFATAEALSTEVANARVWGGIHYRFSTNAGAALGLGVAQYDLQHFGR